MHKAIFGRRVLNNVKTIFGSNASLQFSIGYRLIALSSRVVAECLLDEIPGCLCVIRAHDVPISIMMRSAITNCAKVGKH